MVDISTVATVKVSGQCRMDIGQDFTFESRDALSDATPYAIDSVISFGCHERTLFKGVIKRISRTLDGEGLVYTCVGAEQFLEGQAWQPRFQFYNPTEEQLCGNVFPNATVGDFLDNEWDDFPAGSFVSQLPDWFSSIDCPASVRSLVAGSTATDLRSFLSSLESILAPHPHVKLTIEYTPEPGGPAAIFPVGKLVIIDTIAGRDTFSLPVGGLSTAPVAANVNLEQDTTDCAETINVFGRGLYRERSEVLTPAWDAAEEAIVVNSTLEVTAADPKTPNISFSYFNFGNKMDIIAAPTIHVGGVLCFEHADYEIDYENGRVMWIDYLALVDELTGQVSADLGGGPGGGKRYPIAHLQAHRGPTIVVQYTMMGPDAYRKYRTQYPIANIRLKAGKVVDPTSADPGAPAWVDKVVPSNIPPVVCVGPTITNKLWKLLDPTELAALMQPPYALPFFPGKVNPPTHPTHPNDAVAYGPAATEQWIMDEDAFSVPMESYDFREGANCIRFANRLTGFIASGIGPLAFAMKNPSDEDSRTMSFDEAYRPGFALGFFSWEVAALYVSWENLQVTRTSTKGLFKILNVVFDTCIKYTDYGGTVLQDDTAKLEDAADAVKAYSDASGFTGTAEAICKLNVSGKYEIPMKVGDKLKLTGLVGTPFTDPDLIINEIDYSSLDGGVVTMSFGRKEPRRNPFAPRPPDVVDIEGNSRNPKEISGLEIR